MKGRSLLIFCVVVTSLAITVFFNHLQTVKGGSDWSMTSFKELHSSKHVVKKYVNVVEAMKSESELLL